MQQFKRKSAISVPTLSFKKRTTAYVRILTDIVESNYKGEDSDKDTAAMVCRVLNLEDGQEYDLICPTLMVTALTEKCPDYVGRYFEINVAATPREGKKYKDVTVYELEPPEVASDAPAAQ